MAQVQAGWSTSIIDRALLLVVTASLTARRVAPFTVCVTIAAAVALMAVTPQQPSVFGEYLAIMLAGYTIAERQRLRVAVAGGLLVIAGGIAHDAASTNYNTPGAMAGDFIIPTLVWGVGRIVRTQNRRATRSEALVEQLERDADELAQVAVSTERARLARELHDIVTHSVSVVVIQAQGAQRVLNPGQPDVHQALCDIESAGRSALVEMRRLLGVLRDDQAELARNPPPGLAQVPVLIAQVRATGLSVDYRCSGAPPDLDAGAQLSVYRIAQEALTNALKHSAQAQVTVDLRFDADEVWLRVADDGPATVDPERATGRGLVGMRERVALYGGTLQIGPRPEGGFEVSARLPVQVETR
jgi:signal transduction histidine kinase